MSYASSIENFILTTISTSNDVCLHYALAAGQYGRDARQ
jgi:hypothetical protein